MIDDVFPTSNELAIVVIGNAGALRDGLRKYGPLTEMKLADPSFAPVARSGQRRLQNARRFTSATSRGTNTARPRSHRDDARSDNTAEKPLARHIARHAP